MTSDREWALAAIDQLLAKYQELVAKGKLPPGIVWLWKPSSSAKKAVPNAICIATALGLAENRHAMFYKCLPKKWKDTISSHYSKRAHLVTYQHVGAIVFQTKGLQRNQVGAHKDKFATWEHVSLLKLRVGKSPSELSSPVGQSPPKKRPDLSRSPARIPPPSPKKKQRPLTETHTPLKQPPGKGHFVVEDGVPMASRYMGLEL